MLKKYYLPLNFHLRHGSYAVRENLKKAKKDYAKTEDDLKSLQSVGQIIGEVLRPLDTERCK
jgi:hypothetical protein